MSNGAKTMQVLFIIAGMLSIALGALGSMVEGDDSKSAEWECFAPTQPTSPQRCTGTGKGGDLQIATNFILAGIGLEIAAAAIAVGGRRDVTAPPMQYQMPGQPVFPPRPMPPMGSPVVPAQAPQPGWPTA